LIEKKRECRWGKDAFLRENISITESVWAKFISSKYFAFIYNIESKLKENLNSNEIKRTSKDINFNTITKIPIQHSRGINACL
jgi:hypothetical protein